MEEFEIVKDNDDEINASKLQELSVWHREDGHCNENRQDDANADAKFLEYMDQLYNRNENPAGNDHGIYDPEADVCDKDIGKGSIQSR